MNTDLTTAERAAFNACVPMWAQRLNSVYDFIFVPVNRAMEYLGIRKVRKLAAPFMKDVK
jgi:hypothetical protein